MKTKQNPADRIIELAKRDPEAAKAWLRKIIELEASRRSPDQEFLEYLVEGIDIIDRLVAIINNPDLPPELTLESFPNWNVKAVAAKYLNDTDEES